MLSAEARRRIARARRQIAPTAPRTVAIAGLKIVDHGTGLSKRDLRDAIHLPAQLTDRERELADRGYVKQVFPKLADAVRAVASWVAKRPHSAKRETRGGKPTRTRGSRRVTTSSSSSDPPGGDGGDGEPPSSPRRVVSLAAPFCTSDGIPINGSMKRFLGERGLL